MDSSVAKLFLVSTQYGMRESPLASPKQVMSETPLCAGPALIADGKGLPETAAALRISKNTVHTHLQHIFRKCGVRRQSELVRVLTRATAVLSNAITSSPVGTATPIQHQRDSENGFPSRLRKQTENRTSRYHAQANGAQNALR